MQEQLKKRKAEEGTSRLFQRRSPALTRPTEVKGGHNKVSTKMSVQKCNE